MRELKVDFIDQPEFQKVLKPPSFFQRKAKSIFRFLAILLIVLILLFSGGAFSSESFLTQMPKLSFWKGVIKLIISPGSLLHGEISDRINILLLGMGGADHEGAYLTDTIILASFKPSSRQLALFSLPRDLLVPIPGYGWQKINSANAYGEMKEKDGGKLASLVVSQILDLPVHYFVRLDFSGFKEIIDTLGGIEVEVERSFVDSLYPGPAFSYRTVSFERGRQVMNGERALEFVRSRHGTNNESTDFARMKRQQKVLLAIKNKIEKIKILEEPEKIWRLFHLLAKYFKTNLEFDEIVKLAKIFNQIEEEKIITRSLDLSENSPLYAETFNGAYVLRPKNGDFKELAAIAKNIFKIEEATTTVMPSKAKIVLLNGTFITGLAKSKADLLSNDFEIIEIGNAPERNATKTIIYDLSRGEKKEDLEKLKKKINGEISQEIPSILTHQKADFVIVLGEK
ncbi:MAG: LCP family protein [Patescibacteria group bacterium]|nr:LCP family protein [Patescibacteria group bacterium]